MGVAPNPPVVLRNVRIFFLIFRPYAFQWKSNFQQTIDFKFCGHIHIYTFTRWLTCYNLLIVDIWMDFDNSYTIFN